MTTPSKGAAKKPARLTATGLKQEAQGLSALALTTLARIMRGKGQDSVKLAAAREVLDRAHGKPKSGATKAKAKAPKAAAKGGMTVIVKRFTDITPEEQAAADETERSEW